jgi:C-terminal processing protease CtpA/Prc
MQKPNDSLASKFKKIILLVNEGTASSADDFVYRFKENDNVLIAGQPQSADLTYALITVLYYLSDSGEIRRKYFANAQEEPKVSGTRLFKFDIPYSKTVDKEGNMLQGNPLTLDLLVPITKENFSQRELSVLEHAIEYLINKATAN